MKEIIINIIRTILCLAIFIVLGIVFYKSLQSIDEEQRAECVNTGGLIIEDAIGLYDGCVYSSDK